MWTSPALSIFAWMNRLVPLALSLSHKGEGTHEQPLHTNHQGFLQTPTQLSSLPHERARAGQRSGHT
jgi:hypothetical protein